MAALPVRSCSRRPVAQLVEHRSPKPKVGGSSPSWPATVDKRIRHTAIFMADKIKLAGCGSCWSSQVLAGFYLLSGAQAVICACLSVLAGFGAGCCRGLDRPEPGKRFFSFAKIPWPRPKSGLADAQGNHADHRRGVRVCGGDGAFPVGWSTRALMWVGYDLVHGTGGSDEQCAGMLFMPIPASRRACSAHLIERIQRAGMQDKFGEILVPVEEVVEMKGGQKSITERKFFPGYVLVEMEMDDETWHLVKSTPKVTGFVGGTATKPTPISEKEVQTDHAADAGGCRKAAAQGAVRGGRDGSRQGRSVYRLQRHGRRCQLRKEQACACR